MESDCATGGTPHSINKADFQRFSIELERTVPSVLTEMNGSVERERVRNLRTSAENVTALDWNLLTAEWAVTAIVESIRTGELNVTRTDRDLKQVEWDVTRMGRDVFAWAYYIFANYSWLTLDLRIYHALRTIELIYYPILAIVAAPGKYH